MTALAEQRRIHAHDRIRCTYEDGCMPPASEHLAHLVGDHAREVLAHTTYVCERLAERAAAIPDVPGIVAELTALRAVVGELVIRVAVLEQGDRHGRR